MLLESQSQKAKDDIANVKRIILESPAPVPRKSSPSSEIITADTPPVVR